MIQKKDDKCVSKVNVSLRERIGFSIQVERVALDRHQQLFTRRQRKWVRLLRGGILWKFIHILSGK